MARKDKYYGTYTMIYGNMNKELRKLGYKGSHNQFRVVCKAKSMAEANRIAEGYGLGKKYLKVPILLKQGMKKKLNWLTNMGL